MSANNQEIDTTKVQPFIQDMMNDMYDAFGLMRAHEVLNDVEMKALITGLILSLHGHLIDISGRGGHELVSILMKNQVDKMAKVS